MDPRLSLLCLISKHSIIKGRVLELCNKSINHRSFEMDEVGRARTMIAKWANDVDNALDQGGRDGSTVTPFQSLVLEVLKNETVIALNRPFLSGGPSEEYDSALQACLAASRSIIKSLVRDAEYASLMWPSLTWAAWMSGFITLYATVEGEMPLPTGLQYVALIQGMLHKANLDVQAFRSMCEFTGSSSRARDDMAKYLRQGDS